MRNIATKKEYSALTTDIGSLMKQGRMQAYHAINSNLIRTYWEIGKRIVEYECSSGNDAESKLFERILSDLKLKYGKTFSKSNIVTMRLLYTKYPKIQTLY